MVTTYGYSYIDTFSNAYGLFSPTHSNQDLITFNDGRPPQSQHVETTTEAPTLFDDARFLARDYVTLANSSVTEPVARRTNYQHCKCYKIAVIDALTNLTESRPFIHEVGPLFVSLDNDLLRKNCGTHDWKQLCGKIVFKNSPEEGSI
jgi:hypothetical protein